MNYIEQLKAKIDKQISSIDQEDVFNLPKIARLKALKAAIERSKPEIEQLFNELKNYNGEDEYIGIECSTETERALGFVCSSIGLDSETIDMGKCSLLFCVYPQSFDIDSIC